MPLTLNVGLSKKIGLPDYGSLGVSCNVQVELDSTLLHSDLDGFHDKVKRAYKACHEAVTNELARQQQETPAGHARNGQAAHRDGNGSQPSEANRQHRAPCKATVSQVKAIQSIADRLQLDLASWLQPRYGLQVPADLSISQASAAIDELKALSNGNGAHR
jgi:hypothetical protein